jgi:hypothetical protein
MPQRIERKRTKGYRLPAGAVCISRPSRWGNPFRVDEHGLEEALRLYRAYLHAMPREALHALLAPLRGKDLACWCKEGQPCHGDILLELANANRQGA